MFDYWRFSFEHQQCWWFDWYICIENMICFLNKNWRNMGYKVPFFLQTLHRIWHDRTNKYLVGGLGHFFHSVGNNDPNWLSYFSEGLKPPTSNEIPVIIDQISHPPMVSPCFAWFHCGSHQISCAKPARCRRSPTTWRSSSFLPSESLAFTRLWRFFRAAPHGIPVFFLDSCVCI